jgi:hypothetical protein
MAISFLPGFLRLTVSHAATFGNPAGLLCTIEELGNASYDQKSSDI